YVCMSCANDLAIAWPFRAGLLMLPGNTPTAEETVMSSKSRHVISMAIQKPSFEGPAGSIKHVDVENLSILRRLSLRHLVLAPGGVHEPHWHANANELGYCIRGTALITIAANHSERASFLVNAGDMFFVPSGAMHC
ncbi:cupin domain-containing protein, partial [Mesorhizobium sp. M7A.T.Ca.TU.009.01.3.2]